MILYLEHLVSLTGMLILRQAIPLSLEILIKWVALVLDEYIVYLWLRKILKSLDVLCMIFFNTQLILELGPYKEELQKTGGAIKEFVNPK